MPFNERIFSLLNSLAGRCVFLDWLWIFLAQYAIFIFGVYLMYLAGKDRKLFYRAALSAVIVVIAITAIKKFCFLPRPFLEEKVNLLITHDPNNSTFPSRHAAVAFTLAWAVFLKKRKSGLWLLILAYLVSLSRIIAGVHYPLDVLTGAALGIIISYAAHRFLPSQRII